MAKAPAYQWYPKDYEMDEAVKLMTYEQEGIYRRLLDHQAMHGSIPAAERQIAMLVPKVPLARFLKLWPAFADKFPLVGDRRINRRLEIFRSETQAFKDGKSINGKKGAEARWQSSGRRNGEPMTEGMANACPASAPATAPALVPSEPYSGGGRSERPRRVGKEPPHLKFSRFAIWRWQIEELMALLGPAASDFALDEWFQALAHKLDTERLVVQEPWPWIKAETVKEAQRRGFTVATAESPAEGSKRVAGLVAGGNAFLQRRDA